MGKENMLFEAAFGVQNFFKNRGWPFCFIGGLAVLRWGEIRMTQDVDVCLLCGYGEENRYIQSLLDTFKPRISDAALFAQANRVMLLYAANGVTVDISLSGIPFEEEMIHQSTLFEFSSGCSLRTCSAEDLIVLKSFADRPKDWMDVEGIIIRQRRHLDREYIFRQLKPLCEVKPSAGILDKLGRMLTFD